MITDMKHNIIRKCGVLASAALLTLGCTLVSACQDDGDWNGPGRADGLAAYGNTNIKGTNLKTIADVKALYSNAISSSSLEQIKKPMQIQGIVVGNDEGGNIYQQLYIQDATGAICISISQAGLYEAFAIGQPVMIELNGLYIGGYGQQPQIGTTYTNYKNGNIQVGRMSRYEWQKHYKLLDRLYQLSAEPLELTSMSGLTAIDDCCKLITLKGVTLSEANGTKTWGAAADAAANQTAVNRAISGMSNVVVRTSTYAKFANAVMPQGKVDITGIASYYNGTWQILLRTDADVKASEE